MAAAATFSLEVADLRDMSGSTAGPYRLMSRIGRRGAADLYLANQHGSGTAAVKVVDTLVEPAHAVSRFNEERQLFGRFDHPNLARMLDEGTTSTGALYLAMEDVDGLPVNEFVQRWSLNGPAAVEVFLQICAAVEYLHSIGFAHNDLKPDNIIVTKGPHVKIVDFGATAQLSPQDPKTSRLLDVYDLGLLLRTTMAGVCWPELDQVMWKATRAVATDRFRTVCDLAQRLQRLL
jgi:eukaryotic-like serine/threonine-protein kinase